MTMYRALALATILAVLPMSRGVIALDDDDVKNGIDDKGYISSWLVLAPIPVDSGEEGASALARDQVKDEASLKPKDGDKLEVGGKEYTWKAAKAEEGVLDFIKVVGKETENCVAYAVTTLVLEDEKEGVTLKVGSDDQVRIYLNGKKIHSNDADRPLEKDEDSIEGLTLKKGRNVLVVKVVNGIADWSASARFLDKDGVPIKGITATIEPE